MFTDTPKDPIVKSTPVTETERFLSELCKNSFLSLWSWPSPFQDRGANKTGEGKELCDLLVIFDKEIIIFSDKNCAFPDSGNPDVDWSRWYKRAVQDGVKQLRGAERWLREYPDRVYVDRACSRPLPVTIPSASEARFHLIVVAHSSSTRAEEALGTPGGLVVTNAVRGDDIRRKPFTAGDIDPSQTFIHVIDDSSLEAIFNTLDTVADFVGYLHAKESLLRSPTEVLARSEEDLLAIFLTNFDDASGARTFGVPSDAPSVFVDAGEWDKLVLSGWLEREYGHHRLSYAWDAMIESFSGHTLNDTRRFAIPPSFATSELILRFMAREPRFRRETLARTWLETLVKSKDLKRHTRWFYTGVPGDPYWVFLFFPRLQSWSYDEYREIRQKFLEGCCRVVKLRFPDAEDIIGIASEAGLEHVGRSEDGLYFNARFWDDCDDRIAKECQQKLGIFVDPEIWKITEGEYNARPVAFEEELKRSVLESKCPCMSGKRYADCHRGLPLN